MKITWITRSFLDYRVPVYQALNELCEGGLALIYNEEVVPCRVTQKLSSIEGLRAFPMRGEKLLIGKKRDNQSFANKGVRIPFQPKLISTALVTKPDVIISDGFFQWTYAALYLRWFLKIPHVMCYERTYHTERNAGTCRQLYRKLAMTAIDAIVANGSLTGEYLQTLGFNRDNITYGHMVADVRGMMDKCCDVDGCTISQLKASLGLNRTVFMYVGQIIPRKGIQELLKAWQRANIEDSSLVLVGDGSQRAELERMGVHNVVFVGSIDYDALTPYYAIADCFIIPTLEDNWSLVVPEAMACGLPIACSCYNGCYPELVKPENGWVFDPLNLDSTVDTLQQVAAKRSELKAMGNASRQIVSHYTPETAAQSIWDACQIAIKKH